MSWWTADRKRYALNYLLSAGLSPYGAAGLVSRWANVESVANGPSAVNPYSGAFGIAQWLGSRLPPIRGNTNFDAQLAYVVQELNGPEARAGNVLRAAGSAYEGARGASMYERAEGYNSASGVDNFTARTASGIMSILGYANSATQAASTLIAPTLPNAGSFESLFASFETQDLSARTGISAGVLLLVGAGLLTVYLLTR